MASLMLYKVVGYEKLWFLNRSAVCLLLADCLLFAILADMDSLTQYKDVGYEKSWILIMSAVCLLSADCLLFSYLLVWTYWYNTNMLVWKVMIFEQVSCLFTFSWLFTFCHTGRYGLTDTIQGCWVWKIMNFDHVSCLFTFSWLFTFFILVGMDLLIQYKYVGYEKLCILIKSAVDLLSADCLFLF